MKSGAAAASVLESAGVCTTSSVGEGTVAPIGASAGTGAAVSSGAGAAALSAGAGSAAVTGDSSTVAMGVSPLAATGVSATSGTGVTSEFAGASGEFATGVVVGAGFGRRLGCGRGISLDWNVDGSLFLRSRLWGWRRRDFRFCQFFRNVRHTFGSRSFFDRGDRRCFYGWNRFCWGWLWLTIGSGHICRRGVLRQFGRQVHDKWHIPAAEHTLRYFGDSAATDLRDTGQLLPHDVCGAFE